MLLRLFAIAVFALTFSAAKTAHAGDFAQHFVAAEPQRPAPVFLFQDGRGVTHDLKEYRGHYVLLNLWASWCVPCVNEMPALNDLQGQFDKNQLNIIAVSEDRDGVAAARLFYTRHGLKNLPIYVDMAGRAPAAVHIRGLPTTLLIDPQGFEVGRVEGEAPWNAPDVVAFLKSKMKI